MTVDKFMSYFDADAVKKGDVAFTFYCKGSGKWNFWSEGDTSKEDLIKHVMEVKEIAEAEIDDFTHVEIGDEGDRIRIRAWFDD